VHLLSGECYSICLNRQIAFSNMKLSNNRSVMPLDVLGDTRVTMKLTTCSPYPRGLGNHLASFIVGIVDWKSSHELGTPSKCESLTCIDYDPDLCTHRPSLLPTNYLVRSLEVNTTVFRYCCCFAKVDQTWWFGGNKSRNKVSVGEPAEGSLMYLFTYVMPSYVCVWVCVIIKILGTRIATLL
jgi:hypothetical protein